MDRSSNTATRGNIYVVWMDTRFNDADHNDILLARSTNGGLTWSAPVVVDRTPSGVDAFTPMVDVDARAASRSHTTTSATTSRRRRAVDGLLDHAFA